MKTRDNLIKRSFTNNTISSVFFCTIFFLNVSSILIDGSCELLQVDVDVAASAEELTIPSLKKVLRYMDVEIRVVK